MDNTFQQLTKQNADVIDAQHILEDGTIISKLNILLIGCGTFMSIESLKKNIKKITNRKYPKHFDDEVIKLKKKQNLLHSFESPNFDNCVNAIVNASYDPEILLFENAIDFFAYLLKYTRLSEYLTYIMLSKLLHYLSKIIAPGLISNLYTELNKWITAHFVFAFNGSNFDNILINQELTPQLLSKYGSKISINQLCQGLNCVNLSYSVSKKLYTNSNNDIQILTNKPEFLKKSHIIFRDTRKIVPRGSLNQLAHVYDIPVNKLLFPYAFLQDKTFLMSITYDNILQFPHLFYDSLQLKTMSLENQTLFLNHFKSSMCNNLYNYLKIYLNRDVLVLHKLMNKLLNAFDLFDCNIILQKKLTISNLAFSNIYIFENIDNLDYCVLQTSSSKFIQHVVQNSVIGGYCCSNVANVDINSDFIINHQLKFDTNLSANVWHKAPTLPFNQTCKKILSYDIRYIFFYIYIFTRYFKKMIHNNNFFCRSLYPSAMFLANIL